MHSAEVDMDPRTSCQVTRVLTLITSYDHGLDIAEKINMAAAICYGPQLNRGEVAKVKGNILKYFFIFFLAI